MPPSRRRYSVDEYLAIDRASDERYEYLDGEIYAMAGESDAHADVTTNLVGMLYVQLRGTPCRARSKDTKVRSGPKPTPVRNTTGLYSYPDIVVICGQPDYEDENKDIIANPTVIMEVLSPSTEKFDRGEKCKRFQTWNPTLTDYVLVAQDEPCIERFHRNADGTWSFERFSGLDAEMALDSIHCRLKLADVYERVDFPAT